MIDPELIPKDPRHQRFADRHLAGDSVVDAYLAAGYKCGRASAMHSGTRLHKSKAVQAYIRAVQAASATATTLTVQEKREFLARIVRTPITSLDHEEEENADLIKKYTVNESEKSSNRSLEKLDPLKAIEIDNKLSGDDSESNAITELAQAIASLGGPSPLPQDKM